MVEDNIIEGPLKYRDGKKWKQRWAVLNKLSPVADVLQLRLYRDSRDKARGSGTKGSLALTNPLALITGFTLDKESHTLALLCRDLAVILAFDSRERLLQWNSKINFTLGHEKQFLVQLVRVPMKSRIPVGPSKLHVRDNRFCISTGIPPRVLAAWVSCDVRRYGVIDGKFVWEGGARSGRGAGVHIALSDTPHDITRAFDLATRGALTSFNRRGSRYQVSSGTIQRDAASWLREVGALDLNKFSDTCSMAATEPCHMMSPHGHFLSKLDLSSTGWNIPRRPSCTAHESYITGGGSSSSGSLVGDEPTWWANTWASGQSSLWEVPQSSTIDNLYDSPRPFTQPPIPPMISSTISQNECACAQGISRPPTQLSYFHTTNRKPPTVPENPLDNYDVPKQHFSNYDKPKQFHVVTDTNCSMNACYPTSYNYPGRLEACGRVLGWAGTLMCRKQSLHHENLETVRVNGEGRMPVLDASTGTIVQPILSGSKNISCSCSRLLTNERCDVQVKTLGEQSDSHSVLTDIYAVVDKSKKTYKPRCPTPPIIQDETTPTNSSSQYVNLLFCQECANSSTDRGTTCSKCGGHFYEETITPIMSRSNELAISKEGSESLSVLKKHDDYLIMGPGLPINDNTCIYPDNLSEESNNGKQSPKPVQYRAGRSLSLARRIRSPSPNNRRSTSADSRLHERWDWSETPDPTPCGSPAGSPKTSPYKSLSKSSHHQRGRARNKPSDEKVVPPESKICHVNPLIIDSVLRNTEVPVLRRSSSVPGQNSANRDSASSSDSGVCESPRPSDRILLTHCLHNSLPRAIRQKLSLATDVGAVQKREIPVNTDGKSSSGNSDTSDYLDTLSLSSYSSSDHDRLTSRSFLNTLRPRSGKEYSRLDRIAIENTGLSVAADASVPVNKTLN